MIRRCQHEKLVVHGATVAAVALWRQCAATKPAAGETKQRQHTERESYYHWYDAQNYGFVENESTF